MKVTRNEQCQQQAETGARHKWPHMFIKMCIAITTTSVRRQTTYTYTCVNLERCEAVLIFSPGVCVCVHMHADTVIAPNTLTIYVNPHAAYWCMFTGEKIHMFLRLLLSSLGLLTAIYNKVSADGNSKFGGIAKQCTRSNE